MTEPDVSIVVPARDEAGNVGPLIAEIRSTLDAAGLSWELFVIDDGSTDGTWAEMSSAAESDPRIVAIRQDRGLGKSAALMNGFTRTRGRRVVMLDGDGQDDPAEIPRLLARLDREAGVGLVNGWKTPRLDPWHKTAPSRVFNRLVGSLTGLRLHDHNCGLKAMRGDVARGLALDTDMHRFITVLAWLAGHRVVEQPVHHRPRLRGVSKYGPSRFVTGLVDLWKVAALVPESRRVRAESRTRLRHGAYAILAAVALGGLVGRIGSVASVDKVALESRLVDEAVAKAIAAGLEVDPSAVRERVEREKRLVRPFLSANDRSRWMTIRSLVERGTFAIDEIAAEPGWDTIDAVAHPDRGGRLRLYSSKPPLLAVLCAGPYWLLHKATGWTLGDHPFELGRMLMLLFGAGPLLIVIVYACRLIDAVGTTDWGRIWAAALICCGTLLTTFAVVLTNHLPAAACAAASGWLVLRIGNAGLRSWRAFAAAGLTAALTAAFELPALAWLAAVMAILARSNLRQTVLAAVPAVGLVAAASLGTNWLAHGTVSPPYAHREPRSAAMSAAASGRVDVDGDSWNPSNWYDFAITLPNGKRLESYWRSPRGVDRGEQSPAAYAWHVLGGHHGIFSLTPAWLLAVPGLALLLRRRGGRSGQAALAAAVAAVSVVVIAFYLSRPQLDRNYGGMTSGFRWAFWLAPLWAMATVPVADRLAGSRPGRAIALVLLALSVISAAYPTWNPWTLPWIQQWLIHAGWLAPPG